MGILAKNELDMVGKVKNGQFSGKWLLLTSGWLLMIVVFFGVMQS